MLLIFGGIKLFNMSNQQKPDPKNSDRSPASKDDFFYPRSRYRGDFTPQQLAFNANLQEFAQRVGILCSLETGGKIKASQAFNEIKQMWEQLEASKDELIDAADPPPPDLPEE
jgi:hypothetical protein